VATGKTEQAITIKEVEPHITHKGKASNLSKIKEEIKQKPTRQIKNFTKQKNKRAKPWVSVISTCLSKNNMAYLTHGQL